MKGKILLYENSSGFAQYTYKLCNALAIQYPEYEIHYLTDYKNIYLSDIVDTVIVKPILKVPSSVKGKRIKWAINRLYVAVSNILIRNRYTKENNIDIVSIQSTLSTVDQFFIRSFCKKNVVVLTVHDVIPPIKSLYWSRRSLKKLYDTCKLLIVHSKNNEAQLIEQFNIERNKITVIHHGTDVSYKRISKQDCLEYLGIPNDGTPIVLFFGMIREQKGLDDFIRAMNDIEIPCRAIIAGAMPNGEHFTKYEELIKDKSKFNCFIKFIDEEDVDYLYQASDAVIFPYKYFSSQSGVFMQAIKYRKPIIATNVSSFKQYIDDYSIGVVSEPNDPDALKENIKHIVTLTDNEKEIITENFEKAAYDNSWGKAAMMYMHSFLYFLDE